MQWKPRTGRRPMHTIVSTAKDSMMHCPNVDGMLRIDVKCHCCVAICRETRGQGAGGSPMLGVISTDEESCISRCIQFCSGNIKGQNVDSIGKGNTLILLYPMLSCINTDKNISLSITRVKLLRVLRVDFECADGLMLQSAHLPVSTAKYAAARSTSSERKHTQQ